MPLIQLLEVLIVVGVLLWLVNRFIPMQSTIKSILNGVVVIANVRPEFGIAIATRKTLLKSASTSNSTSWKGLNSSAAPTRTATAGLVSVSLIGSPPTPKEASGLKWALSSPTGHPWPGVGPKGP